MKIQYAQGEFLHKDMAYGGEVRLHGAPHDLERCVPKIRKV